MTEEPRQEILDALYQVVQQRKSNPSQESYVASLFAKGEDKILSKVGEEAVETILAAKSGDDDHLVKEIADLLFHLLVLMGDKSIAPDDVRAELERRFGTSGHEEKASRKG